MSTKIFDAYKVTGTKDPWALIWSLQEQGKANVTKALRELYWDIMIHVDLDDPDYIKSTEAKEDSWNTRLYYARDLVQEKYKEQRESPYRDDYNFDIEIGVTPFKRDLYVRAFCDHSSLLGKTLDFMDTHPNLQDYHYQNSTDRPKDVSARAWNQREKNWKAMMRPDTYSIRCMSLDICSRDSFIYLSPWLDMARAFTKNPPVLPTPEEVSAIDLVKKGHFENTHAEPGLVTAEKNGKSYRIACEGDVWKVWVDGELSKTPGKDPKTEFAKLRYATSHVDYLGLPDGTRSVIDRMIARYEEEKK